MIKKISEKNVDTTFSQPLQWILCEGRLAKNLYLKFKNLLKFATGQPKKSTEICK